MALPNGMSSCSMCVEIMTGTSWVDVSDNMSVVEPPTQTRMAGQAYVFGEDVPLTTVGKREPADVTVRGVWAQGTADPFYTVYSAYTTPCGGLVAVRWSPAGCATTADTFYTNTTRSELISLQFPGGDSADANPIMYQFVVHSPEITRGTWA